MMVDPLNTNNLHLWVDMFPLGWPFFVSNKIRIAHVPNWSRWRPRCRTFEGPSPAVGPLKGPSAVFPEVGFDSPTEVLHRSFSRLEKKAIYCNLILKNVYNPITCWPPKQQKTITWLVQGFKPARFENSASCPTPEAKPRLRRSDSLDCKKIPDWKKMFQFKLHEKVRINKEYTNRGKMNK